MVAALVRDSHDLSVKRCKSISDKASAKCGLEFSHGFKSEKNFFFFLKNPAETFPWKL